MELHQLRYFIAAAKHEHMTLAAKELYITQPTLSRTIAQLEKDIGFPLFDREQGHVRLNEAGREFLVYVERCLESLEKGGGLARKRYEEELRHIHFSSTRDAFFDDLTLFLLERDPDCTIEASGNHAYKLLSQVLEGAVDFVICMEDFKNAQLLKIPLPEESLVIVSFWELPYPNCVIPLSDLDGKRFYFDSEKNEIWQVFDACCRAQGATPVLAFEGTDPPLFGSFLLQEKLLLLLPLNKLRQFQANMSSESPVPYFYLTEPACAYQYKLYMRAAGRGSEKQQKIEGLLRAFAEQQQSELSAAAASILGEC